MPLSSTPWLRHWRSKRRPAPFPSCLRSSAIRTEPVSSRASLAQAAISPAARIWSKRLGAKWLQLLKEIAPRVKRVAIMFNPDAAPVVMPFSLSAEASAHAIGVETVAIPIPQPANIAEALTKLGHEPGVGLMLLPDIFAATHRKLILELAARYSVPAIYPYRFFVDEGGLLSYGTDPIDQFAQAGTYVDRILRGAKPGELPVQAPTKFELVINLKTAKALGLDPPITLLARTDEVIE